MIFQAPSVLDKIESQKRYLIQVRLYLKINTDFAFGVLEGDLRLLFYDFFKLDVYYVSIQINFQNIENHDISAKNESFKILPMKIILGDMDIFLFKIHFWKMENVQYNYQMIEC